MMKIHGHEIEGRVTNVSLSSKPVLSKDGKEVIATEFDYRVTILQTHNPSLPAPDLGIPDLPAIDLGNPRADEPLVVENSKADEQSDVHIRHRGNHLTATFGGRNYTALLVAEGHCPPYQCAINSLMIAIEQAHSDRLDLAAIEDRIWLHVPESEIKAFCRTTEYHHQAAAGGFEWDKFDPTTKLLRRFYGCRLVVDGPDER